MPDYVDLEVELSPKAGADYVLACRLDYPNNSALPVPKKGPISFDLKAFEMLRSQRRISEYGATLGEKLFGSAGGLLSAEYRKAKSLAVGNTEIRLRLLIDD